MKLIKKPFEFSLSNNPIRFDLKATKYTTEIDVFPYAEFRLEAGNKLSSGRYFQFSFINPETNIKEDIRFNAKISPKKDGEEVPGTISIEQPSAEYINELIDHVKENKKLTKFYNIASISSGPGFVLNAKLPLEELIITDFITNDNADSGYTIFNISAGISAHAWEAKPRDNHRVFVDIYVERSHLSDDYILASRETDTVNNRGIVQLDLSDILHSELMFSFDEPPLPKFIPPTGEIKHYKNTLSRRYFIEYYESWPGIEKEHKYRSEVFYVHPGGVSLEDYAKDNPVMRLISEKRALTWWPQNKKSYREQQDWISFINYTGKKQNCLLSQILYYKDGTTDTFIFENIEMEKWDVITCPCGFEQTGLNLNQDSEKEVYAYEIILHTGQNPVTTRIASQRFILTEYNSLHRSSIILLNSFFVPETFVTTGAWKKDLQVKKELASRALQHDFKRIKGQDFVFSTESRNAFVARSGNLTKKEADYLQELIIQSPTFLIEPDKSYSPIIINGGKFTINDESQILEQIEMQIIKSFPHENFSKDEQKVRFVLEIIGANLQVTPIANKGIGTLSELQILKGDAITANISPTGNKWLVPLTLWHTKNELILRSSVATSDGIDQVNAYYAYEMPSISFLETWTSGAAGNPTTLTMQSLEFQNLTFYWGGADESEGAVIGTGLSNFSGGSGAFERTTLIYFSKIDKIIRFEMGGKVKLNQLDFHALQGLQKLSLIDGRLEGYIEIPPLKSLKELILKNNLITDLPLPLLPKIELIDLENNSLNNISIERLVISLWNFRKVFNQAIIINIKNNPGVSDLTLNTVDIINGTGAYEEEGLNDYDITVII